MSGIMMMLIGTGGSGFSATISTNQADLNLRTWALANGWDGTSAATITLDTNTYIYATTTSAALTINGSWPGGVTFVNNGYVMGLGGKGGGGSYNGSTYTRNVGLTAGSDAISLGLSCTIANNSYIGGGGGGGGSNTGSFGLAAAGAGGGAGGGSGSDYDNNGTWTYGGAGGSVGSNGVSVASTLAGGGGGRIMPGTDTVNTVTAGTPGATATSTGGGGGNSGSASTSGSATSGTFASLGGQGGSAGGTGAVAAGYSYGAVVFAGGGGGGWGASGGSGSTGIYAGAAGGKCVALNGFTVTWSVTGTRYGAIA